MIQSSPEAHKYDHEKSGRTCGPRENSCLPTLPCLHGCLGRQQCPAEPRNYCVVVINTQAGRRVGGKGRERTVLVNPGMSKI